MYGTRSTRQSLAEEVKKGTRYWLAEGALLKKRQCVGEVWEREG